MLINEEPARHKNGPGNFQYFRHVFCEIIAAKTYRLRFVCWRRVMWRAVKARAEQVNNFTVSRMKATTKQMPKLRMLRQQHLSACSQPHTRDDRT